MSSGTIPKIKPTEEQSVWGRERIYDYSWEYGRGKSFSQMRYAVCESKQLRPVGAQSLVDADVEELRTLQVKDLSTIPSPLLRGIWGEFSSAIDSLYQNRPVTQQSPKSSEITVRAYTERKDFGERIALLNSHLAAIEAALRVSRAPRVRFKL